jgi:hypothetical protein
MPDRKPNPESDVFCGEVLIVGVAGQQSEYNSGFSKSNFRIIRSGYFI